MKLYPHPVTGAFILNPQQEILLVKSPKWDQGKIWAVPGGHVEWGETIEASILREVKEEVGIVVDFEKVFSVWDVINPPTYHQPAHFIFLECLCRYRGQSDPIIDQREVIQAIWFRTQALTTLPLETWTKKSLSILYPQLN